MSRALAPRRITQQPVAPRALRWSNPLLRNVNFVLLGSAVGTRVNWNPFRKALTYGINFEPARRHGNFGIAPVFRSSADVFAFLDAPATGGTTPWTIAGIFIPTAVDIGSGIVGTTENLGSASHDRELFFSATGGNWEGFLFDGAAKRARSTAVPAVGRADTVIITTNGSTFVCAVKGYPDATTAVSTNGHNGYTSAEFIVGTSSGTTVTGVGIPLLVHTRRFWNASERASFFANPWQIFAPDRRQMYWTNAVVSGAKPWHYYAQQHRRAA